MLRTILLAAFLSLAALAPGVTAAVGESCFATVWTTGTRVECDGLLYEAAAITWCPQHPLVTCVNQPILTCVVSTTARPAVECPPLV